MSNESHRKPLAVTPSSHSVAKRFRPLILLHLFVVETKRREMNWNTSIAHCLRDELIWWRVFLRLFNVLFFLRWQYLLVSIYHFWVWIKLNKKNVFSKPYKFDNWSFAWFIWVRNLKRRQEKCTKMFIWRAAILYLTIGPERWNEFHLGFTSVVDCNITYSQASHRSVTFFSWREQNSKVKS